MNMKNNIQLLIILVINAPIQASEYYNVPDITDSNTSMPSRAKHYKEGSYYTSSYKPLYPQDAIWQNQHFQDSGSHSMQLDESHESHGHGHAEHSQARVISTSTLSLDPDHEQTPKELFESFTNKPIIQNIIALLSSSRKNRISFLHTIHFKLQNELGILWQDLVVYFYFTSTKYLTDQKQQAFNWLMNNDINSIYQAALIPEENNDEI